MEATRVGSWVEIGYNAPGKANGGSSSATTNFGYGDAITGTGEDAEATWTATARTNLNDCTKGKTWTATASSETNSDAGTTYVKIETDGDAECIGLTPSFKNLARATAQ